MPAHPLDPELVLIIINELDYLLCGRSSSAAKKAGAALKIAFVHRSSRFSRSNSTIRTSSSVVTTGPAPSLIWAR